MKRSLLKERYTRMSEKDRAGNQQKKVISDDAFAVCEFIEEFTDEIRRKI